MTELEIIKLRAEKIFGIKDISVKNKSDNLVIARAAYYYVARKKTKESLANIGKSVNRDYTTIIFALKKMDVYFLNFKGFKEKVEVLLQVRVNQYNKLHELVRELKLEDTKKVIQYIKQLDDKGSD